MAEAIERADELRTESAPWLLGIERVCELITLVALAAMVAIMVVDVTTRNFMGFSFQISDEVCGYMLVIATFFAMPVSLMHGGMHRLTFVEKRLGLRGQLALQVAVNLLSLTVCGVIEWQLIRFAIIGFSSNSHAMTDLGTPLWIPQSAMPIGFGLLCLILAVSTLAKVLRLFSSPPAAQKTKG